MSSIPQAPPTTSPTPTKQPPEASKVDPIRMQMFMQRLRGQQSFSAGLLAGFCAAIAGAILWAIVTAVTNYQIGWMAIGVGFIVGLAVRQFGQGIDQSFAIAGAALALFGCMLGNLLAVCIVIAHHFGVSYWKVVGSLDSGTMMQIMAETFRPMDLLFYAIAIWAGYKYSLRRLTGAEIQMLAKQG